MNKTQVSLKQYKKGVLRLAEILEKEKNEVHRDSAIKRFELCFDLSWKLLKDFLKEERGISCRSPKDCFRQAFHHKIIEINPEWLRMTDQRNAAVHTYNEQLADGLYKELSDFLKLFQGLQKSIENY